MPGKKVMTAQICIQISVVSEGVTPLPSKPCVDLCFFPLAFPLSTESAAVFFIMPNLEYLQLVFKDDHTFSALLFAGLYSCGTPCTTMGMRSNTKRTSGKR